MNYVGGMWEGGGGQDGVELGGKWDNCNSIINKYIFFKKEHMHTSVHSNAIYNSEVMEAT